MTKDDWNTSKSAPDMLSALHTQNSDYFKTLIPILHRYFLACCWKIKHLIPQEGLRNGLLGTEKWIKGEIDDKELYRLDWHSEAECFIIDYAETTVELKEIQKLIDSIDELKNLSFDDAKNILKKAAYFANTTMVYPGINHAPFVKSLCTSQFLCPDLLRKHVNPEILLFEIPV